MRLSAPISNFIIAVNDRKYNAEPAAWEDAGRTFYEVTVSGEQAVHFASSALKGTRLLVAGDVYVEEYRDNENILRRRRRISVDHHDVSTRYAPAQVPTTVTH